MALFKAFDFVLFQNLPQLLLLVKYLVQRLSLLNESAMITTSYKFDGYSCNAKGRYLNNNTILLISWNTAIF
jgi:hypothetical protein